MTADDRSNNLPTPADDSISESEDRSPAETRAQQVVSRPLDAGPGLVVLGRALAEQTERCALAEAKAGAADKQVAILTTKLAYTLEALEEERARCAELVAAHDRTLEEERRHRAELASTYDRTHDTRFAAAATGGGIVFSGIVGTLISQLGASFFLGHETVAALIALLGIASLTTFSFGIWRFASMKKRASLEPTSALVQKAK